MATVIDKVRPLEAGQLAEGVGVRPVPLEILGQSKAMQARYDSLGNIKGGFGSLVEKKGRYWYYEHGCLYYKSSTEIFEVHGEIYKKWVKLGGANFGKPNSNESNCADNTGRFNLFEGDTKIIMWHPSTGAYGIWGDIKVKWNELSWEQGYLGYPTSDEVDFPDGGRVNAFEHGGIYWWPDTGAMDINDVVVHYTGLMCFKEMKEDQSSDSDEPYVTIGVVTPFGTGAYQSRTYEDVDSGESNPDSMEIYRGKPNGIVIAVRLMEWDKGDRGKITRDIAKGMTQVHKLGTEALKLISVVGSGIASVAGPLIQEFIPALAGVVNGIFGFGDDEVGRQTIVLTGKDMILAARRNNSTQRGIGFKFASNNFKGGVSNYKVYFGVGAV